jgi:hypothetical protein
VAKRWFDEEIKVAQMIVQRLLYKGRKLLAAWDIFDRCQTILQLPLIGRKFFSPFVALKPGHYRIQFS